MKVLVIPDIHGRKFWREILTQEIWELLKNGELEKLSDKQKERQEAEKEAGKEDDTQRPQAKRPPMEASGFSAYAKPEAVKRTTLTASTQDELIEQIQNLDWDAISKEEPVHAGMRFDSAV